MNKSKYNQLMKSKEAKSFGTLGPQNSLTKGMLAGQTATSYNLHGSDSTSLAGLDQDPYAINVGTQANDASLKMTQASGMHKLTTE